MTDPQPLLTVSDLAALLLFVADARPVAVAEYKWREADLAVRHIRGRKIRTVNALFDETAAALQFPYYFGENWAAFDECLSDMEWLPMAAGIVLVIDSPTEVLADESEVELEVLVQILRTAAETYAEPIALGESWDRPGRAVPRRAARATARGGGDLPALDRSRRPRDPVCLTAVTDKPYVGLGYRSRDETLRELASGESDRVTEVILAAALHSSDAEWVVSASIALGVVPDREIQRAAIFVSRAYLRSISIASVRSG